MRIFRSKNGFTPHQREAPPLKAGRNAVSPVAKRPSPKPRLSSRSAGFTLAEILVVTALFAILMALGAGIYLSNNRFYENQSGKIGLLNQLREAADRINEFGRSALSLETSYVYSSTTYTTGANTLIFKLPAIDSSQNVISQVYDHVIISRKPSNSNHLELIVDVASSSSRKSRRSLLSDKLTNLSFTYDNLEIASASSVNYDITLTETSSRNPATEKITGGVSLRNK